MGIGEQSPGRLLARANARSQAITAEALAAAGVTGYQARILAALADEGSASQAELSRRTGLDPSDVVATVGDLVEGELVTRERDRADARRNVVALTRTGRREATRLDKIAIRVEQQLLAPLSDNQRVQLVRLLARLAESTAE